ncbi:MAG: acyl-CoA thioesterase [Rhodospirillales bacterium]|nr:acyl-CoA thioesterase [Rhodospirillales bacterium]
MTEDSPTGELAIRTMAMPADTNPSGDIFGGWLMSQMDIAGGMFAQRFTRGRIVTVALEAMTFHLPVFVGDELSCYVELARVGRTSLTVKVVAWVRHREGHDLVKVTEGTFTYVALGADRRPRLIPQ